MRFLVLLLALLPIFAMGASDTKATFKEGEQYTVLEGRPKPPVKGKIEVTELFWYGCGHCYNFESMLSSWEKTLDSDVKFNRSPAMWRQRREPQDAMWTHAKLYYTAAALGQLETLHPVFFDAMHKRNLPLTDRDQIAELVKGAGLDGEAFAATMDSFAVNSQVQQADARQRAYKVTGTPEIVVGGYYHVTAGKAGSQKEMLEVTDYLIDKIRSERGGPAVTQAAQ